MSYIQNQIKEAAQSLHISVSELSLDESEKIFNEIKSRFTAKEGVPLWEYLKDSVSVHNPNSWRWIDDYVANFSVIMFFNPNDEKLAFNFPDGSQIVPLLEQTIAFEFYLTNRAVEYLICFNHHDFLIASGTAEEWLKKKLETVK